MFDILEVPKVAGIKRFSGVSILPYVANVPADTGMRAYGMVMHDGVVHADAPYFAVESNLQTYTTGLNEAGPEVTSIKDLSLRDAKIKEIRKFIKKCEEELAGNFGISDEMLEHKKEFYDNVKTFKSVFPAEYTDDGNGIKRLTTRYWDKLTIELRNEGYTLNVSNTEDRLRQYIIEAGGYGMIAPNLEAAKKGTQLFYLDKVSETSVEDAKILIDRDEAGALLRDMYKDQRTKLFYVTKMLSSYPLQWKTGTNGTSEALMYTECTNFMDGKGTEPRKKEAIKRFLSLAEMHPDDLKIHCYVNDGLRLGLLSTGTDGTITHTPSSVVLGRGINNVFAYLKAGGENEPIYIALANACEEEWKS